MFPIEAAVKIASPLTGGKLDLHRAFGVTLCSGRCRRYADFLNGVGLRLDDGKEAVRSLQQVVLNIKAVKSDIQQALWQAVDGRLPGPTRCARARQEKQKVKSISRRVR